MKNLNFAKAPKKLRFPKVRKPELFQWNQYTFSLFSRYSRHTFSKKSSTSGMACTGRQLHSTFPPFQLTSCTEEANAPSSTVRRQDSGRQSSAFWVSTLRMMASWAASSMWGVSGGSCEVHYSASKAALIGMTKALAKEVGPSGIRVNCVSPGAIETDMMAGFSAEDKQAIADETPLGRLGKPEEIAAAVAFLASADAAFITGQVLAPNGGMVI